MPTSTWSTMRQDILRPMGLITSAATTSALSSGAATVVDTKLRDRFPVDDYFNNQWYVHITSGNDVGKIRRITDYTQSSGTLTYVGTAWAGGDSPSFELTPFDPTEVMNLFNEALEIVYPDISMIRDIETIVTGNNQHTYTLPNTIRKVDRVYMGNRRNADTQDNLLLNGDFEDWTSATSPDYWSVTGTGASVNQEEDTSNPDNYAVLHGNNSARLIVPSSTVVTLVQTFDSTLDRYTAVATQGMECNVSAWVYCTVASRVSLTIDGQVQSNTHSGTGWELLKGSEILTQTDTEAAIGLSITSGGAIAVFVDEVWMTLGQSEMADVPYSELRNWSQVPPVSGSDDGGVLYFQETLPSKYRLRIVGRDVLTPVSAEASTIEIDGDLLHPLYNKTRQLIALRLASSNPNSQWTESARQYEEAYLMAIEGNLVGVKAPLVAVPRMVF
jgi:hypothetical protein